MAEKQLNALVSQKIDLTPTLVVLRVVPDGWELLDFKPGQFTVIGLPGSAPRCPGSDPDEPPADPDRIISRAYSIASSSQDKDYLEFYISLVRSGALTPRIFHLAIGNRLWLSPKVSGFLTLEGIPADARVVMIATGTGLAPYMSMVRSHLNYQNRQRLAIIHGARHSWDLGYRDELLALQRLSPAFTYIPVIDGPQDEPRPWPGHTGFVQDIWKSDLLAQKWGFRPTPADTHILLCGHPAMIESMEAILQSEGFAEHTRKSPGQYHLERFW